MTLCDTASFQTVRKQHTETWVTSVRLQGANVKVLHGFPCDADRATGFQSITDTSEVFVCSKGFYDRASRFMKRGTGGSFETRH